MGSCVCQYSVDVKHRVYSKTTFGWNNKTSKSPKVSLRTNYSNFLCQSSSRCKMAQSSHPPIRWLGRLMIHYFKTLETLINVEYSYYLSRKIPITTSLGDWVDTQDNLWEVSYSLTHEFCSNSTSDYSEWQNIQVGIMISMSLLQLPLQKSRLDVLEAIIREECV